MISLLTPVANTGQVGSVTADVQPAARPIFLNQGDILKGIVLWTGSDNRVMLQIGADRFIAAARIALNPGAELVLRVEEAGPQTVLQIIADGYPESQKINQYLVLNRSNPRSLADIFTLFRQNIDTSSVAEYYPEKVAVQLQKIEKLLDSLVISPQTVESRGFVKDYIHGLGLLLETGLFRSLDSASWLAVVRDRLGLKGELLKLSEHLQALGIAVEQADNRVNQKIVDLLKQAQRSVTAIEIQQVINVLAQDEGSPYLLQIPMAFPDGLRFQSLYIEKEAKRGEELSGARAHRIVLFLDMDILGEMMAEVRLAGAKLRCRLKCREETAQIFLAPFMTELKDRFQETGLVVEEAACIFDPGLTKHRREYQEAHAINIRTALNLFA